MLTLREKPLVETKRWKGLAGSDYKTAALNQIAHETAEPKPAAPEGYDMMGYSARKKANGGRGEGRYLLQWGRKLQRTDTGKMSTTPIASRRTDAEGRGASRQNHRSVMKYAGKAA